MNKKFMFLILALTLSLELLLSGCGKPNYTITITEEDSTNNFEDTNSESEYINKDSSSKKEELPKDIQVYEYGQYSRMSIVQDDKNLLSTAAIGGIMDWCKIENEQSAGYEVLSVLYSPEEYDSPNRTYKYQKENPAYAETDTSDLPEDVYMAKEIISETVFKYNVQYGIFELSHEGVDIECKNIGKDYLIRVNGKDTYDIRLYETGYHYKGDGKATIRPYYGFNIKTLRKDKDIGIIDAITVAIIALNNIYVYY